MSKRYEVKRFSSCYSMNWLDNKTHKELTSLDIEKIINKQHKQIADLEAKLSRTQNELSAKVEYIHELVEVKDNYKKQLKLTEKALELSCKNEFILNVYPRINDEEGYVVLRFHYYIKQAKEMMKSD